MSILTGRYSSSPESKMDTPINIKIGDKAPNEYFKQAFESAERTKSVFGYPMTVEDLRENLSVN